MIEPPMLARLAFASEVDSVVALGRQCLAELSPHLEFDEELARKTFHAYMTSANPTILVVVEDDGAVVGFATGWFTYSGFSATHSINLDVVYTRPDKRDGRAAALLAEAFDVFARRTAPGEITTTTMQGIDSADINAALVTRGYQVAGTVMRRVPSDV